jgi:hypothetical protein
VTLNRIVDELLRKCYGVNVFLMQLDSSSKVGEVGVGGMGGG